MASYWNIFVVCNTIFHLLDLRWCKLNFGNYPEPALLCHSHSHRAFFVEYCAEEFVKEKGDTRGVKIVCVLFFVLAVLAACFVWFNIARNLIASFDPPSIELTHLSAEYHQGDPGSYDEPGTTDEWTLFGVDSDGKEHVFTIDEDEYYRLTKVGKEDYVTSGESYWIIEFDEDVRLICKYLPWGSLVDFEITE